MTDDQGFEDAVRALLEDPAVDAGVVACVPLTAALETLPGPDGRFGEGSIVTRLVRLRAEIDKPWVAVVDSGRLYDAMARALEAGGVPTFRSADRAMRLLGTYVRHRLTAEL
jgi:acyl-CoA synthetase (NDP forming)